MTNNDKSAATWSDVKAKLGDFDCAGLLGLVQDLYTTSKDNQNFLHARFGLVHKPYKTIIERWLRPDVYKNQEYSVSKAKKPITDYKKASGLPEGVAELRPSSATRDRVERGRCEPAPPHGGQGKIASRRRGRTLKESETQSSPRKTTQTDLYAHCIAAQRTVRRQLRSRLQPIKTTRTPNHKIAPSFARAAPALCRRALRRTPACDYRADAAVVVAVQPPAKSIFED
jgi:hypothetical protein